MPIAKLLLDYRDDILRIAARHGATNVRVFGSMARGDDSPDSDVDLLIDIAGPTPPWFPGGLLRDLEDLLGRSVEIATVGGLKDVIRSRILEEAIPL